MSGFYLVGWILLLFESDKKLAPYQYVDYKLNDRQNYAIVHSQ